MYYKDDVGIYRLAQLCLVGEESQVQKCRQRRNGRNGEVPPPSKSLMSEDGIVGPSLGEVKRPTSWIIELPTGESLPWCDKVFNPWAVRGCNLRAEFVGELA